jgi:hypothetical protein
MPFVLRSLCSALVLALSVAACGGGSSSGSSTPVTGPTSTPVTPGSVAVTPSTLAFSGPGAAAQTFTLSSTVPNAAAPIINSTSCGAVATIGGGSSTLPATYTVTPTANGSCSIVVTIGTKSAALGVTVGAQSGTVINGNQTGLTFSLGGQPQSYTVTSTGSGGPAQIAFDTSACAGIATITGNGGTSPQSFTATPIGQGTCNVTVISGSSTFGVPITVNGSTTTNGLIVTPSALSFSSHSAAPQNVTIGFQGLVGSVSIDESSCTNPRIAFFTVQPVGQPVSLPATGTVTPYTSNVGSGTCTIVFTPQTGSSASLSVSVSP